MKKFLLILAGLVVFNFAVFSADNSNYTSTDDVKKAQMAMASNEYYVTPGDLYSLVYQSAVYTISVDSNYKVRIANLGIINTKGMTIQDLKNKVETLVVSNYPTSGVQFFLSNPSQFNVYVKGEVSKSTSVNAWALNRLSDIISGYFTSYSSKRDIKIISIEGEEKIYDLFYAERYGDLSQNPYIRPGDQIIVSKAEKQVSISGEVKKPGKYQLKSEENLQELIEIYADGFTDFANKNDIQIKHFVGGRNLNTMIYCNSEDLVKGVNVGDNDQIVIGSLYNTRQFFNIEGALNSGFKFDSTTSSGKYRTYTASSTPYNVIRFEVAYTPGEKYSSFLCNYKDMFLTTADLEGSYIIRKNGNGTTKVSLNINDILNKVSGSDADEIMPDDLLIVPSTQMFVSVNGGVVSKGRYPYLPDKNWIYYVNLANGFDLDQNMFKSVKIYDKDGKRLSKKAVIPPEATIIADRNSPKNGWLIPMLTALITFISATITFYGTVKGFRF